MDANSFTEETRQREREDKELYDNFPKWEKEFGQVLAEYWAYYFLQERPSAQIGWSQMPNRMKNYWIATALALIKTLDKDLHHMVDIDIFAFPDEIDKLVTQLTGALDKEDHKEAQEILSRMIVLVGNQKAVLAALETITGRTENVKS